MLKFGTYNMYTEEEEKNWRASLLKALFDQAAIGEFSILYLVSPYSSLINTVFLGDAI